MTAYDHPLSPSIVRIRTTSGGIAGAGYLTTNSLICTCAHVVADALGIDRTTQEKPNTAVVTLDFPFLGSEIYYASIEEWQPINPNDGSGDIAVLRLSEDTPLPPRARPARLLTNHTFSGRRFGVYGFPQGHKNGVFAQGELGPRLSHGWIQIEDTKVTGFRIQRGFSGAPVWDVGGEGVVGMVVAAESDSVTRVGFLIPCDIIQKISQHIPPPIELSFIIPYLTQLQERLDEIWRKTTDTFIPLKAQEQPGKVELPAALNWKIEDDISENDTLAPAHFYDNFHALFSRFDGRLLLLGQPGAGKTTTLIDYARYAVESRLSDSTQPVPIVAQIASWDANRAPSFSSWLGEQITVLSVDEIEKLINSGDALLLLDGLDELGGEQEDKETKQIFDPRQRFVEQIPQNGKVLVTCRVREYAEIGQKIRLKGAALLAPLSDVQRQAYLAEYPSLLMAIERDEGLRTLTKTPLILSYSVYAFKGLNEGLRKLHDLSHGELRDAIIGKYIQRRYNREKSKEERRPNRKIPVSLDKLYEILGQVAMNDAGGYGNMNIFSPQSFRQYLGGIETEQFLEFMCLLDILRQEKNTLRFSHLLLRDHFAFKQALKSLLDLNNDSSVRDRAAWALWQIPDERAIDLLISALDVKDEDKYVRGSVAGALGRIGSRVAIEPLKELRSDTRSVASIYGSRVCEVAEWAIKRIEDYEQSPARCIERQIEDLQKAPSHEHGSPPNNGL